MEEIIHETEQRQRCVVDYQVATYSGQIIVYCDCNDENDVVEAKARRQLTQSSGGNWPIGYQSFTIVERENYYGD